MNEPSDELQEMVEQLQKIGDIRLHIDNEMLKIYAGIFDIQSKRNSILQEILDEIRRLRVTGIQP